MGQLVQADKLGDFIFLIDLAKVFCHSAYYTHAVANCTHQQS